MRVCKLKTLFMSFQIFQWIIFLVNMSFQLIFHYKKILFGGVLGTPKSPPLDLKFVLGSNLTKYNGISRVLRNKKNFLKI